MKFTTAFTASFILATLAIAIKHAPHSDHNTGSTQCAIGELYCCNSMTKTTEREAHGLLGALGILIEDVIGDIGSGCSPITGIGAGGGSCNVEPVCCENNAFGSLFSIGCVPVNIG